MAPRKVKRLSKKELLFVSHWAGNDKEAAKLAGYKQASKSAYKISARPHVAAALQEKQDKIIAESAVSIAEPIRITRNKIINGLADIFVNPSLSEGARVSAGGILADIFRLRPKFNGKPEDLFAGWTDEQISFYVSTGEPPPDIGCDVGAGVRPIRPAIPSKTP
jgi:hypothetical protein